MAYGARIGIFTPSFSPITDVGVGRKYNPRSSAHQGSPRVLADLRCRSRGVHVAEEVLDAAEGDAAALVAHLQARGRRTQAP